MAKKAKIVIVEDDPILLKALNVELLGSGFEVLSVTDGEAALKLVKKAKPNLILLDIILPKLQGFEVLSKLKKEKTTKKIPVILLTNLGQDADKKKGLKLGAVDYCIKATTDLGELTKKIRKILKIKS